jgi:hypothetical protein
VTRTVATTSAHGGHHEVEPQGVDHPAVGAAHRVAEHPGAVGAPPALVNHRIVQIELDGRVGLAQGLHDADGQQPPQRAHVPGAVAHEPAVGVLGAAPFGVDGFDDAGDGAPPGREHPAGDEIGEDRIAGGG